MPPHVKVNTYDIHTIKVDKYYTFTLNPCNTRQYFGLNSMKRVQEFTTDIQTIIQDNLTGFTYEMHLEISTGGRLHYHGKIKFNTEDNIKRFYLVNIINLISISVVEIDEINDKEKWDQYITKQDTLFGKYKFTDKTKQPSIAYTTKIDHTRITEYFKKEEAERLTCRNDKEGDMPQHGE